MKVRLFLTKPRCGTASQWCFTLLDCLHSHGQEFGPPKTAPEKHGNHWRGWRVESRSELTSLPCKVAFRAVFLKNSQPTTQPTVWYALYDLRGVWQSPRVL